MTTHVFSNGWRRPVSGALLSHWRTAAMATRISRPAQEVFWSQATPLDQRMDTFVPLSSLPLVAFVVCSLYGKSTMVSPVASMLCKHLFSLLEL